MKSLKELRAKKEAIKQEISNIEKDLSFQSPKKSLALLTNGYTDKFLTERPNKEGELKTKITFTDPTIKNSLVENAFRLGITALVTQSAKKQLFGSSWKKKIIAAALIYLLPFALEKIRVFLDDYAQKHKN